ncbi:MAG: hypothetical protein ACN4G0_05710 [Polyangiales bacterium]
MTEQRRNSFINFRGSVLPGAEAEAVPMSWQDICADAEWQGRWVALDDCAYNDDGEATAGLVVDHDENLADLCARLSAERRKRCSVVFCPAADESAA